MIGGIKAWWYVRAYENCVEAEQPEAALEAIEKAARVRPDDQEIVAFHAYALYVNLRLEEAGTLLESRAEHFRTHGGTDEWRAEATGLLGQVRYHQGQFVEARRLVAQALEIAEDPKMHWAGDKYFLGLFLRAEGDAVGAARMFRMVEEDEPAFYQQRIQELFKHALKKEPA